jgi:prepilin peptidase CpaA
MNLVTLLPFACACAFCDLNTRRIPNSLILCGLTGTLLSRILMVCRSFPHVLPPAADGLAGFLLPWLCLGMLAALKMIGGGDVKLLSVIGLELGAKCCMTVMWYSLLIGAAWSAFIMIRHKSLAWRMSHLYQYVQKAVTTGTLPPYRTSKSRPVSGDHSSGEFCFAVPILCALLLVLTDLPHFLI